MKAKIKNGTVVAIRPDTHIDDGDWRLLVGDPTPTRPDGVEGKQWRYAGQTLTVYEDRVEIEHSWEQDDAPLTVEARFDAFLSRVESIPIDATAAQVRDEVREAAKQARKPAE